MLNYIRQRQLKSPVKLFFNVLDAEFAQAYIDATGASYKTMSIGAAKCNHLGCDLSQMHADAVLNRSTCGLPRGDASMGFPKWVYEYSI